jgi:hypothetical protein
VHPLGRPAYDIESPLDQNHVYYDHDDDPDDDHHHRHHDHDKSLCPARLDGHEAAATPTR